MQALTLHRHRPRPARLLIRRPALWLSTAAIGAGAGMFAGVFVAIAVLGGTFGVALSALRLDRVRAWLERSAERDAQRARREARETQLEEAGVQKLGLEDATALVDHVTAADPELAAHLELDALLDRYVELELAIVRYSCLASGHGGSRRVLESSATRTQIRNRSVALRRACEARLEDARDELASIVELLQLLVERTALNATELESDPVGERMALLDN